ncbi:Filamentous hemagglutinin transporter [Quillaja saponaria]|uniref:Filamentous hemagglutinin transporter n=1 Tax=Quillaja saponaria TaxID=32244 RepID=A0AAD7PBQ4_QUISA|nr:Filamentous hemagglutinin transporter [Quillaja saponaria]
MAADVSSLMRFLSGSVYKEDQHRTVGNESGCEKSTAPITRDLLGGSSKFVDSQELDLDLQVPSGCEKRLDLKSGKVYIQRCNSLNSPAISDQKLPPNATVPKLSRPKFSSFSFKSSLKLI